MKEKHLSSSTATKTFQFDKVFGPQSKQLEVYRSVVEPLITQVTGLGFILGFSHLNIAFLVISLFLFYPVE